jgi:hypothetical protein
LMARTATLTQRRREMSYDRVHGVSMTTATANGVKHRSLLSLAGIAIVILTVAGSSIWTYARERETLLALPKAERQLMLDHALGTINSVCLHVDSAELADYCREQARVVARLPECDKACEATCQKLAPRPTR